MNLTQVEKAASRLRAASVRHESAREGLRKAIEDARENGATLTQIGGVLGISRQSVHEFVNR